MISSIQQVPVASGAPGRGVLRLLLVQQQIILICIPAICLQLYIVVYPSAKLPTLPCITLEILLMTVTTNGTIGHLTVALGRLFYLYQDEVTFITEENFFMCLAWFHPALLGMIVAILLGENFLDSDNSSTSLFFYSSCSKIEMLWDQFNTSIYLNVFSISSMAIVLITVFIHILLLKKHRQLRKKKADGTMIISYNGDGISMTRRQADKQLCHKLWKHERTVITPKASQFSFIVRLFFIPFTGIVFHTAGSHHLWPLYAQLLIFTLFSQVFVLNNIVETIFSPNLRYSLIDFFGLIKQSYPVINV